MPMDYQSRMIQQTSQGLVLFSSAAACFNPNFYEFVNTFEHADASLLYMKKTDSPAWYLYDVPRVTAMIDEFVETCHLTRLTCIGLSSGGFASLFYGYRHPLCRGFLSFCPQTVFTPEINDRVREIQLAAPETDNNPIFLGDPS